MAHHEVSGRPLLQPRAMGTGLAAALLAELMLGGSIVMRPGGMVAACRPRPADGLAGRVHDQVAGEPELLAVPEWLLFLARTAAQDVAARLARSGYLTRAGGRLPWQAPHNTVWRYIYALGRADGLPAALGRTGGNNIPKAASLAQSATGLAVIVACALAHGDPMTGLFFGLGTTGGFGILILLAATAVAVIAFFARDARGESAWARLIAPALAAVLLGGIVVLAVLHYGTLLGAGPGDPAAWALPGSYAAVTVIGLAWGLVLRARRPQVYAAIGLGAHAVTGQTAPARHGHLS